MSPVDLASGAKHAPVEPTAARRSAVASASATGLPIVPVLQALQSVLAIARRDGGNPLL